VSDKLLNLCAQSVAEVAVSIVNEDPMNEILLLFDHLIRDLNRVCSSCQCTQNLSEVDGTNSVFLSARV
jgi:hypothetical protein